MDRDELIRWGLGIVKMSAGGVALDDSGTEWFLAHFGPSADRLAEHPGAFKRFQDRLAEHLDHLGDCAAIIAIGSNGTGPAQVTGENLEAGLRVVGERYGVLTSLCDPPPDGR